MPTPDDPSEMEAPLTRALFATDVDEDKPRGSPADPDGTVGETTQRLTAKAGGSDAGQRRANGSDPAQGSISAWTGSDGGTGGSGGGTGTGSARRGIIGKIEPGQTLYAKYQVIKKLGSGAMGEVWLVRHATLKSQHALKVIVPNFATNAVALMRFKREFEVMASLRHEHAVTIYDACIDDDGGYIDMEFVDGQTIHEILAASRTRADLDHSAPLMPLDWIVRLLDQLCDVLQVAHEKGIVHRDLKPSNMMLLSGRKPGKEYLKVLDFGIAKVRDDPDAAANRDQEDISNKTQGFIGTPSYGSPEQAMAMVDIDGRADLYSVGIMLYEFIAGKLPFRGNHWQVMSQNATAPPPPFAETNPQIRPMPEVEHAVFRVLAKSPGDRPQTARELFEEFRSAVEAVLPAGAGLTPPTWDAVPYHPPTPSTAPTAQPTEPDHATAHGRIERIPDTLIGESYAPEVAKHPAERSSDFAGVVQAEPKRRAPRWSLALLFRSKVWAISITVTTFAASAFLIMGLKYRSLEPGPGKKANENETKSPGEGSRDFKRPPSFVDYWTGEYRAVIGFGEDKVWPDKVRRTTDQVTFKWFADGIYLPEGYKAEEPIQLVDGWPRVIVRDDIRFIRIQGGEEWEMGAWDAPLDLNRNDAPAHPVILSGYYMQETEVTNGQIEDFFDKTPPWPTEWKEAFDQLKGVEQDLARQHPAVCLSRRMALAFAAYMNGNLPTEAQWEYAARSRGQKIRNVWGDEPAPSRDMARIHPLGVPSTAPVKRSNKDKTQEGLYDMTGNVKEMCRDAWERFKQNKLPLTDPCAIPIDTETPEFAIRGASYDLTPELCAITRRDDKMPEIEFRPNVGFRVVVECPDTRKPRRWGTRP